MTSELLYPIANLILLGMAALTAIQAGRRYPGFWSLAEEPPEAPPEPFKPPKPSPTLFFVAFDTWDAKDVEKVLIDHGALVEEVTNGFMLFRPQEGDDALRFWERRFRHECGVVIGPVYELVHPDRPRPILL